MIVALVTLEACVLVLCVPLMILLRRTTRRAKRIQRAYQLAVDLAAALNRRGSIHIRRDET